MADQPTTPTEQPKGPVYPSQVAAQQTTQPSNGLAIAALITGILGLGIIALILGILGLKKANKENGNGKGMAIAGIILGIIGIIATILLLSLGALAYFGVLSPSNMLPEKTTFQAPLPNIDNSVIGTNGIVTIPFRNNKGSVITIPGTVQGTGDCAQAQYVSGESQGTTLTPETQIPNGDIFTLRIQCDKMKAGENFKADITFNYNNVDTNVIRPHMGTVMGIVR